MERRRHRRLLPRRPLHLRSRRRYQVLQPGEAPPLPSALPLPAARRVRHLRSGRCHRSIVPQGLAAPLRRRAHRQRQYRNHHQRPRPPHCPHGAPAEPDRHQDRRAGQGVLGGRPQLACSRAGVEAGRRLLAHRDLFVKARRRGLLPSPPPSRRRRHRPAGRCVAHGGRGTACCARHARVPQVYPPAVWRASACNPLRVTPRRAGPHLPSP